jgi:hypothetical protein
MTETATNGLVTDAPDGQPYRGTGYWSEDAPPEPTCRVSAFPLSTAGGVAALFVISSSTTAVADPSLRIPERDTATAPSVSQAVSRKRISIGQARRLALAVLAEAERERAEYADEEARIAAIWEDEM